MPPVALLCCAYLQKLSGLLATVARENRQRPTSVHHAATIRQRMLAVWCMGVHVRQDDNVALDPVCLWALCRLHHWPYMHRLATYKVACCAEAACHAQVPFAQVAIDGGR